MDDLLSDTYKEAFGVRPRGVYQGEMTPEQYLAEVERLQRIATDNAKRERAEQAAAEQAFWYEVSDMSADYGIHRGTAIRWVLESEGLGYSKFDLEHLCYLRGMSYATASTLAAVLDHE